MSIRMKLVSDLDYTSRSPGNDPTTILLHMSDKKIRVHLAIRLRCEGYQVIEAENGLSFLTHLGACLTENPSHDCPDIIIADLTTPGLSSVVDLGSEIDHAPVVLCVSGTFSRQGSRRPRKLRGIPHFFIPLETNRLVSTCAIIGSPWRQPAYPYGDEARDYEYNHAAE